MTKLLGLWLAWRVIRVLAAVAVIALLLSLLVDSRTHASGHRENPLAQLQRATHPLEQQLQDTIEKAFKP